jgi:hypothetical protein
MWPLTSGSTCYSGTRKLDSKSRARFAIEWHTCALTFDGDASERPSLSWREITESEDDSLVCVGYSATTQWECLALVDASKLQPTSAPNQNPAHEASRDLDDHSVSTATTRAPLDTSSGHDQAHLTSSTGSITEPNSHHLPPAEIFHPTGNVALLILRNLIAEDGTDFPAEEYTATLDFRPLAPTACQLVTTAMDTATDSSKARPTGIWLGSSDNTKIHWFEPRPDNSSLEARSIESEDPAFQFTSPVMAIDFQTAKQGNDVRNCLAVACQDGTIRTITFGYNMGKFVDVRHQQVIVDGPIVCIDLQVVTNPNSQVGVKLRVTAGSLCGYVMELFVDPATCDTEGPYMVGEGFWNAAVKAEDSVLAVRASGDTVFVGTQSGKLLVYGTDQYNETDSPSEYQLLWQCQLPYSIHSVCCVHDTSQLLVTTRRSLHVFKKTITFDYKARAASIKSNLLNMIEALEREQAAATDTAKINATTQEDSSTESPVPVDAELNE